MNIALINDMTTDELRELQAELIRDEVNGTMPWHGDPTGEKGREVLAYITMILETN